MQFDEFKAAPPAKRAGGNRGKVAEKLLEAACKQLAASNVAFDWERIPDAFSSRGSVAAPRTGDLSLTLRGRACVLEVKEVEHDFRLPRKNFSLDSRARMRRRKLAGALCLVAVYHSTTKLWRLIDVDAFGTEDRGSWDFSNQPAVDLATLFQQLTVHL